MHLPACRSPRARLPASRPPAPRLRSPEVRRGPRAWSSSSSRPLAFLRRPVARPRSRSGFGKRRPGRVRRRHEVEHVGALFGSQATGEALVRRPDAAGRVGPTAWADPASVVWLSAGASPCALGGRRPSAYPPLRHRVAPERGGSGAAHDLSRAERVEDGGRADEHSERAGLEGAGAGGIKAPGGYLDGGNAEHGGLARWRRVHPSDCRKGAVRSRDAKALKVSRYAQEREARVFAGVGPNTKGSRTWMTPKRPAWPRWRNLLKIEQSAAGAP